MTKQEFLAMSLPYGLKMCYEYKDRIDIHTLLPMHFDCKFQLVNERGKPILHPLSDLTKFIEHKGEKIIPLLELKWNRTINGFTKSNIEAAISTLSFKDALKLIEWHFDIAKLIDKGEAIDVNTLRESPYK